MDSKTVGKSASKKSVQLLLTPKLNVHEHSKKAVDVLSDHEMINTKNKDFNKLTKGLVNIINRKNSGRRSSIPPPSRERRRVLNEELTPDASFILIENPLVGKFGAYYQAFDRITWKKLTLKIYRPFFFHDGGSKVEKLILSLSNKPIILPKLYAAFTFQLQRCLVLERLETTSLQEKLMFCRRFTAETVQFFMSEIVLAVSYLHSKGVVHRNLTLDAFWIQYDGHLKLTELSYCVINANMWNMFSPPLMSIDYAAPEMFSYNFCSKDIDMWAMGIMLYKMTSGRKPFYGSSRKELIHMIKHEHVNFTVMFDTETINLCAEMLAKNPKYRIGHNKNTHLSLSVHAYFDNVNWDEVLSGRTEPPSIPLLFSAEHDAMGNIASLDLRVDNKTKMRIKPLLLNEITTKNVFDIFGDENLEKTHAEKMARYKRRITLLRLRSKTRGKNIPSKLLDRNKLNLI